MALFKTNVILDANPQHVKIGARSSVDNGLLSNSFIDNHDSRRPACRPGKLRRAGNRSYRRRLEPSEFKLAASCRVREFRTIDPTRPTCDGDHEPVLVIGENQRLDDLIRVDIQRGRGALDGWHADRASA